MFLRMLIPAFVTRDSRRPARPEPPVRPRPVKKLTERAAPEHSQTWRLAFQIGFLLLNLWIGARFYFFVRYYETGGQTVFVPRPPGVEGWLPIAALMNLKFAVETWTIPPVHAAGL